ncbi:unnamed protein product, partial [marine sediment metagenome]
MPKIRILFYKAKRDGHFLDDFINLWTWPWNMGAKGPYSHCEVWVGSRESIPGKCLMGTFTMCDDDLNVQYHGTCYTSTKRGAHNGSVSRPAAQILTHPDRWDYIEINLFPEDYAAMMRWMAYAVKHNRGYDTATLLKFFNPFSRVSSSKK